MINRSYAYAYNQMESIDQGKKLESARVNIGGGVKTGTKEGRRVEIKYMLRLRGHEVESH